jgi:hypothetical protein
MTKKELLEQPEICPFYEIGCPKGSVGCAKSDMRWCHYTKELQQASGQECPLGFRQCDIPSLRVQVPEGIICGKNGKCLPREEAEADAVTNALFVWAKHLGANPPVDHAIIRRGGIKVRANLVQKNRYLKEM